MSRGGRRASKAASCTRCGQPAASGTRLSSTLAPSCLACPLAHPATTHTRAHRCTHTHAAPLLPTPLQRRIRPLQPLQLPGAPGSRGDGERRRRRRRLGALALCHRRLHGAGGRASGGRVVACWLDAGTAGCWAALGWLAGWLVWRRRRAWGLGRRVSACVSWQRMCLPCLPADCLLPACLRVVQWVADCVLHGRYPVSRELKMAFQLAPLPVGVPACFWKPAWRMRLGGILPSFRQHSRPARHTHLVFPHLATPACPCSRSSLAACRALSCRRCCRAS